MERVILDLVAAVEVAVCDDRFVAEEVAAVLGSALGDADHPAAGLMDAALHDQMVGKALQAIVLGHGSIVHGGVVAEHDRLRALQAHDPVGLERVAVVADAHADEAAEALEHRKAQVAGLEVALLQMMKGALPLVRAVIRQMHLAVLADDPSLGVNEDRCVEMAPAAARASCTSRRSTKPWASSGAEAASSFAASVPASPDAALGVSSRPYRHAIMPP